MRKTYRSAICWMLVAAMIDGPMLGCSNQADVAKTPTQGGQPTTAADPGAKPGPAETPPAGRGAIELGYVTPQAMVAAVAFPRRVLTAPEMAMAPIEVLSAAGKKELGFDPLDVEQVLAVAEALQGPNPPQAGVMVRLTRPVADAGLLPALAANTTEAELDGKKYRRASGPMDASIFRPDDRTIIIAHDDLLRRMLQNHAAPKAGRVSRLLEGIEGSPDAAVVFDAEPIRPLISAQLAMAPLPPPFAGVKKLPELIASIEAQATLIGGPAMSLTVRARDEVAAKDLEQIIHGLMQLGRQLMLAQMEAEMARGPDAEDPVQQASVQYAKRMSGQMFDLLRPQRDKDTLRLATHGVAQPQMASVAVIGVLVALLLPAIQAAREAVRRASSTNNLRQIGLAMQMSHEAKNAFPARANFDAQGKPLLSWRVHILPHLGQQNLYQQFHLDEPWDSEHNRKLIPLMPKFYQNPSAPTEPGKAHYLAVTGKGTVFEGPKGRTVAEITDGTSNTIMVVEVDPARAVEWTRPDDWEFDPQRPLQGLGRAHPGGFGAAFCDGSVRFIPRTIDPKAFAAMLTIAGGEVLMSGDF